MGYHMEFEGYFEIDTPLDSDTLSLLQGLNKTRRMARNVGPEYGIEGEYYYDKDDFDNFGQRMDSTIIDYNRPPKTQPGLWCKWETIAYDSEGSPMVGDDASICHIIQWDGGEKFKAYDDWIVYLIDNILAPRGYKVTGIVRWRGEDFSDVGAIHICENTVTIEECMLRVRREHPLGRAIKE